jgi:hypothetical protein
MGTARSNASDANVRDLECDANWDHSVKRNAYAYLVLLLFFVPVFIVLLKDRRSWYWDDAFYGEFSVSLFQTLLHSPLHWPTAMVNALGDRAPGIAWLGQFFVPLGHMLPFVQSGLLCFTWITQVASTMLLFRILRKSFQQALPALVTCCIVASGPLLIGLTDFYLVEPLQAFSTVWVIGLAAYQNRLSRPILFLHAVSAVAFGLLAKTSTPLFQFPALLYLTFVFLRKRRRLAAEEKMWDSRSFLYASIVGTTLIVSSTVAWYVVNFHAAVYHVVDAASGSASLFYGHKGSFLTKFWWWSNELQKGFFWLPLLVSILVIVPRALFMRWKQHSRLTSTDTLAILSTGGIVSVLGLFALNINEDTRYIFALLPYVAFVVCWVASNVRSNKILFLLGTLAAAQFAVVTAQNYGAISPRARLSNYLQPYERNDLALRDSMLAAAKTLDSSARHRTFVGEGVPDFNANGLLFYGAMQGGSGGSYVGLGWVQTDAIAEWHRIRDSDCKYYVYRKYPAVGDTDPPNQVAKALFARVIKDREFNFRADKSNERVLIFERTEGGARYTGGDDPSVNGFQGVGPSGRLPYGLLEFPTKGYSSQATEKLRISGWAVSPSGINRVEVLFDRQHLADASRLSRPDVVRAYPGAESTGFAADINLNSLPEGTHEAAIKVYGRDGSSRFIADVPISTSLDFAGVNPEKRLPFGLLEFPKKDTYLNDRGDTQIAGWTVSPSDIDRVEILLDGKHVADAAKMSRPDVKKTYPGFRSTGFTIPVDLRAVPVGPHQISAISYARDGSSRVLARTTVIR